jgi:hypothetical protein
VDADRFRLLMDELAADVKYAIGERPFPHPITDADAVAVMEGIYEAIDQGAAIRERKAAESRLTIACSPGCAWCCEQPVLVWLPDAMVVARFLERPENAEARAQFLAAYPAWRAAVGDSHQRAIDAAAAQDGDGFMRAHREAWSKRVVCALNRDGLCTVYAARPTVCRNYHALGTADHCRVDDPSGIAVSFIDFPPFDQLVSRAKLSASGLHHALGGGRLRMVSLCEGVYQLLTRG